MRTNKKCNHRTWDKYTDGCCSPEEPCAENEGDCSNDNECIPVYVCGKENCPKDVGFHDRADCCELPRGPYKFGKSVVSI